MRCAGLLVCNWASTNSYLGVLGTKYGLALPFGKVYPGETPLDAAIRETFEETGLAIDYWDFPPFDPPYVAVDHHGNESWCFLAYGCKGTLRGSPEGRPLWVKASSLVSRYTGHFHYYNQGVFEHYGIPIR